MRSFNPLGNREGTDAVILQPGDVGMRVTIFDFAEKVGMGAALEKIACRFFNYCSPLSDFFCL